MHVDKEGAAPTLCHASLRQLVYTTDPFVFLPWSGT